MKENAMTSMPIQAINVDRKTAPQDGCDPRILRLDTDPDRDNEDDGSFNDDDLDGNGLNDDDDEFQNDDLDDGLGGALDDDDDQSDNDDLVTETESD